MAMVVTPEKLIQITYMFYRHRKLDNFSYCFHTWEWIEQNDSMGLVRWSEEALEAKQGHARNIRKSRCFQGDLVENLKQCHQQIQLQSDLVINRKFAFRSKENVSRTLFAINFEFGVTNFITFIHSGSHTQ